jgi:hypothetical protein
MKALNEMSVSDSSPVHAVIRNLMNIMDEAQREADNIGQSVRRGDQSKKTTLLFIVAEAKAAIEKLKAAA